MPVLAAKGVRKSFRGERILDSVSLSLEPRTRYGLVGPNGSGKSTLARILAGLLEPDEGAVQVARDARVVYLSQRSDLAAGRTVREEVRSVFDDLAAMEERIRALEAEMARAKGAELEALVGRHAQLLEEFVRRGGYERDRRVEAALDGLGVPLEARDRDVATLSGGQQTRVGLARALLRDPEVLILDEPTNHLDLDATEWLEGDLLARSAAILVISHDRWFLDRVAQHVFDIEGTRLYSYRGNYEAFARQREERRERERKEYERQQAMIRKEEEFIRRNIAAQRVAMARGKRKRLARLTRLEAPEAEPARMAIPKGAEDPHGSDVLALTDVTARIGDLRLFVGLSFRLPRGERLGVVGPNGVGKTTLLRILTGELAPHAGSVERGHKLSIGYLAQEPARLAPGLTVLETVHAEMPAATAGEVRSYLARFLFRREEVDKAVEDLSGGEAARLSLALLFLSKPNFLVLDEPTNHLDIPGREALEAALAGFPGTVLLVSHDRYLLEGVADRILEIRPDGHLLTIGGWEDHLRHRRRLAAGPKEERERRKRESRASAGEAARVGKPPNPYKLARLEEAIIRAEERVEEIHAEMAREEVYLDPERIRPLLEELPRVEAELERLNAEWEAWGQA